MKKYYKMVENKIFEIQNRDQFITFALETFRFQAQHCEVYRSYITLLGTNPKEVTSLSKIPFLPIELFKTHTVYCGAQPPQHLFLSSATTGLTPSFHHIALLELYQESFLRCFTHFFGSPEQYTILALLPSYLERPNSSLVYMVNHLMKRSGAKENRFYLNNHKELYHQLSTLNHQGKQRTLLFGLSFALLQFLEEYTLQFPDLDVVETGGMKGRAIEISRTQLHQQLREGFGTTHIHSEYGMAELLSQGYAKNGNLFTPPPWMAVLIRDFHDPFRYVPHKQKGGINIIDLANRYSCSFIETQDMGVSHTEQTFEILGRIPFSDLRGCNLLLE